MPFNAKSNDKDCFINIRRKLTGIHSSMSTCETYPWTLLLKVESHFLLLIQTKFTLKEETKFNKLIVTSQIV